MFILLVQTKRKPISQMTDIELRHSRKQNIAVGIVALSSSFYVHLQGDWFEWLFRSLLALVFIAIQYRYWQEFKKRKIEI
jgi:hypothetical protein